MKKAHEIMEQMSLEDKINMFNKYALTSSGRFSYHEGDEYKYDKVNKFLSQQGQIELAMTTREIALSDMYIAYAVILLGAADIQAVQMMLEYLHKKWPDKLIPYGLPIDALKNRLNKLANSGCVRSVGIVNSNGNICSHFFTVPEIGALCVRRALALHKFYYDPTPLLDKEFMIYRRLVVSRVIAYMLKCPQSIDVKCMSELFDPVHKVKFNIWGNLIATDETGKTTQIIIEPLMFKSDPHIKTPAEVDNDIKDRLAALGGKVARFKQDEEKYDDIKFVFIIEDFDCLNKAIKMVLNASVDMAERSYFTSERLISLNEGYLPRSFYALRMNNFENGEQKPAIVLAEDAALFGVDDKRFAKLTAEHLVKLGLAEE